MRFGGNPADALQQRLAARARHHETVAAARQFTLHDHQRRLQPRCCRRAHPAQHSGGARAHLFGRVAGHVGAGQTELVQQQHGGAGVIGRNEAHHDMLGGLGHLRLLEPHGGMSAWCRAPAAPRIGRAPDAMSESSDSGALQELDDA